MKFEKAQDKGIHLPVISYNKYVILHTIQQTQKIPPWKGHSAKEPTGMFRPALQLQVSLRTYVYLSLYS